MHPIEGGFAWLVETVGVTFLLNLNLMAIMVVEQIISSKYLDADDFFL